MMFERLGFLWHTGKKYFFVISRIKRRLHVISTVDTPLKSERSVSWPKPLKRRRISGISYNCQPEKLITIKYRVCELILGEGEKKENFPRGVGGETIAWKTTVDVELALMAILSIVFILLINDSDAAFWKINRAREIIVEKAKVTECRRDSRD